MNTEINIWENLNLSEDNLKTAYHYLASQTENFNKAVKGELKMEIEVKQVVNIDNSRTTLYILFIIAPQLGNFRRKIFHISEFEDLGRFPVDIYNYADEHLFEKVEEFELLDAIKDLLESKKIKAIIENLYRQSIEARKNKISV